MNKKNIKTQKNSKNVGSSRFVANAVRLVYGVFFLGAGLYFIATQATFLSNGSGRANLSLFVLALYLAFTGFVLLLPDKKRLLFVLSPFKGAPLAQLLLWLAIPFLWIGVTLFARGNRSSEVFIALVFGLLFIVCGLFVKKIKG